MGSGGGILHGFESTLTFNGKTYVNTFTPPAADQETKSGPGKIVISASSDGKVLFP